MEKIFTTRRIVNGKVFGDIYVVASSFDRAEIACKKVYGDSVTVEGQLIMSIPADGLVALWDKAIEY